MDTELRKRLEEAAERFAIEKCKRKHIDETYNIYPTFFRLCKEDYFEMAEDVWKEATAFAKEWLKENAHLYSHRVIGRKAFLADFEYEMLKLWEGKK